MTHTATMRKLVLRLTAGLLIALTLPARAACNNPEKWAEAPGPDTKVFIGYEQYPQHDLAGEPSWSGDEPFPIPLPKEMESKAGTGHLSDKETSRISYYEPDGKGNWRICRVENWWPPEWGVDKTDRSKRQKITHRYTSRNAILEKLPTGYTVIDATLYFYDNKGRIESVTQGDFEQRDAPAVYLSCRSYDEHDRIILWVRPTTTNNCRAGSPDKRDTWTRFKYGEIDGQTVPLLNQMHAGKKDGSWIERISPFRLFASKDAPMGNIEIDSVHGVTSIWGSTFGKLDDNAANTVLNSFGHWNGASYFFTSPPVPVEVISNRDLIYKYARRRQTFPDGQFVKLFEFFKPNEHIAHDRYYMLDAFVLRHEQVDARGRVTRVITIEDWRQPLPGPKPDVNDKLLTHHELVSLTHQVFHRVYDIDENGKPTLVAVSWNRALRIAPFSKVSIDLADLVYGTPSGKERWTEAQFEKKFKTSANADQVFPKEPTVAAKK